MPLFPAITPYCLKLPGCSTRIWRIANRLGRFTPKIYTFELGNIVKLFQTDKLFYRYIDYNCHSGQTPLLYYHTCNGTWALAENVATENILITAFKNSGPFKVCALILIKPQPYPAGGGGRKVPALISTLENFLTI